MEKKISVNQFRAAVRVAQACNPLMTKRNAVKAKIKKLEEEFKMYDEQIQSLEQGIISMIGCRTEDIIKKVVEPGIDANGQPKKTTKYVATDKVTYNADKKQYIITIPEEKETIEVPLPQTGNDYDLDKEYRVPQESEYVNPVDMEVFQ